MTLSQVERTGRDALRAAERNKLERAIAVIGPFVSDPQTCPLCDGDLTFSTRCTRCGAQL